MPTASPNFQPCKAMAVPPPGSAPRFFAAKSGAGHEQGDAHGDLDRAARQARHHAGSEPGAGRRAADHGDQQQGVDQMAVTKISVSAIAAGVWPTLSVPGINSSGTMRRNL